MGKSVGQWKREAYAGNKKRRRASFLAKYPGTCGKCHGEIAVGRRARYNASGVLVHDRHSS